MLSKRKYWLFGLVLVLIFAIVGCSGENNNGNNNANNSGTNNNAGNDNESNNSSADGEVVTYHYFNAAAPGDDINTADTTLGKMFEEDTGVNIDIEYIVGDVNQKIGTMIASGEYPEILNAEQSTDAVIDAGGFIPLNDLIEEYGPNIKETYGPYLEMMKKSDGNIYVIPAGAGHGYAKPAKPDQGAWWIKREVLKELDYPHPKTLDEYFDIIEEYANEHPTIDGMDTIGFTALTDDWRFFAFSNQPMHLAGYPNDGGALIDMETQEATVYNDKDITKNWLEKINEINDKGLFDPETFTQNYDEYLAKISSECVLGFFDYRWQAGEALNALEQGDDPYAEYMGFPIVFEEDIKGQYLDPPGFMAQPGLGITINTSEEDQIRIIKFLDYLAQEENQKLVTWGIEGETYEIDDDGRYYRTEEQIELTDDTDWREEFGFTSFEWSWLRKTGQFSDGNAVEPPMQPEVFELTYTDVDREFLDAYGIETFTEIFPEPDERPWFPAHDASIETGSDAQLYEQQLDDLMKLEFPNIVLSDPSEFEDKWNVYKDKFSELNYEAYEKVMTDYVQNKASLAK